MTSRAQLDAEIDTQIPNNTSNFVSPAIMRGVLHDMVGFSDSPALQVSVANLNPPVLPNGSDQTLNLQSAIDTYSAAGGAVLLFGPGTYIFNNTVVIKPNIILRGIGIDITILKIGLSNTQLLGTWAAAGPGTGTAGIEKMTLWGFSDRNLTQTAAPLSHIGPFVYYWYREVKGIFSQNMSLKGYGTYGLVDNCIVDQSLRDGINLTGTTYIRITNNSVTNVGDDGIAYHLANGTTGVNDSYACVTGNRLEKCFGIKLLGVRNAQVANNSLRFYSGYGINIGIDTGSGEGLITRFSISVTGNTILDGLNGNETTAGNIAYGIFLLGGMSLGSGGTSIPVNVGQYLSGPKTIQTPDVFINQAGAAQPRGPDGNISIVGNDIRQTLGTAVHFSDYGFGIYYTNTGPTDITLVNGTLIGEMHGIGVHTDIENFSIIGNNFHGVNNGVEFTGFMNNVIVGHNNFYRLGGQGISMSPASTLNGSVSIDSNIFDIDPYLEATGASGRTTPIDGSWKLNDGSSKFGVFMQNNVGVSITKNRFRNCLRSIKGINSSNWLAKDNIHEFDWTSANAGAGNSGIGSTSGMDTTQDIIWFCNSDPRSASFNQYDQNFTLSSSSIPVAGTWFKGTFVRNNNPSIDGNNLIIFGWIRLTSGSGNVSGTDWGICRTKVTSP